jgi:tetratricopeptide (TPR) repeat protein
MKSSKYTLLIVALVLTVLYVGDEQRWFQRVHAQVGPAPHVECEQLRSRGDERALACYGKLAASRDPLEKAEGLWGLGKLQDANSAFREAIAARKNDPHRLVRWGYLYVATDQAGEARAMFEEALDMKEDYVPALLAMADVLSDSFDAKGVEFAEKALTIDPKAYQAHEILARVALEDNYPDKAADQAKKALAISPNALQALAILATIDQMEDKPGTEWLNRIFQINPKYGEAYETMGHFFVINRRYDEGIELYRKALELRPDLWTARAQLGVNLMRFGKDEEAFKQLEFIFNNGPTPAQVIVRNTLKLLDLTATFDTATTPTTILKTDKKETALIRPYFQAEVDRAMATYEKKYKFKLNAPFRLEVYPNHTDFEVRTMGLPGLGALGVTFGKVVAMDSPSTREPGDFHWAATLWHELSHVYVLSMTDHRVPRWFTEGLAVYEESALSPDWGDRMTPREVKAIQDKKLLGIADLDRGFIHPTYPEQVIVSYFQGGRVLTFIVEKWGFDAVLQMIQGFKDRKDTVEVVKEVLKVSPEDFDKQFFAWLDADTKKTVDGFKGWTEKMKVLNDAAAKKDWDKVIAEGPELRDIYPDFVERGSAYELLSQAYLEKGDKAKAISALEGFAQHGGRVPALLKKLSDLQAEAGNKQAAAAALEKLNFIYLKDEAAHQKLGDLLMDLGNPKGAAREYGAVVGGGTVDPAGAHYNLARALHAAGQDLEAEDHVFKALEAAPAYKPAQKLLLELKPAEQPARR